MAAKVYWYGMRANVRLNMIGKVEKILKNLKVAQNLEPRQLVAIKVHFGELGNTAHLRPNFVIPVVEHIRKHSGKPFLTDTNTLYRGHREDAASHLENAYKNGFAYSVVGAPVIIADGLRANDETEVPISGDHFQSVYIGNAVHKADGMVVLSHFKGHPVTGFGGAIKNLGMGCGTRRGKLAMHSGLAPKINEEKCKGDRLCVMACTFDAISMVDKKARIDEDKCVSCGECIGVCPYLAISVQWGEHSGSRTVSEKLAEYALGAVAGKKDRVWYINFVMRVAPECDCFGHTDMPIVPDLGIFASTDPVALDQACLDAVNQVQGLPGSALGDELMPPDKFQAIHRHSEPEAQLIHAEKIGLGSREYELIQHR